MRAFLGSMTGRVFATLLLGDRAGARRLLDAYVRARPELRPYVAREPAFRGLLAP